MSRIAFRRGTTAQWAAANPVLAAGEPGVDLTTGELRIGDGTSTWSALPSIGSAAAGDDAALYGLAATTMQVSDINSALTMSDGLLVVVPAYVAADVTVDTLACIVEVAGVTPGLGVNVMGLYDAGGTRLGVTGDMTTALESTGYTEGTLTSAVALTGGSRIYIALLTSFTGTAPTVLGHLGRDVTPVDYPDVNSITTSRFQSPISTALPASLTYSSMSVNNGWYWLGCKS